MKQLMEGHLKKNGEKDNVELVAWHEAGHALAGLLMGQDLTKGLLSSLQHQELAVQHLLHQENLDCLP